MSTLFVSLLMSAGPKKSDR